MSKDKKESEITTNDNDDLDRLARQMLIEEAKRNKIRAETHGVLGWQKPTLVTNRKFLQNTLISNAVHNINKNEQQKQQRINSMLEKNKQDNDYKKSQRKRSRTPSPSSSSRKKRDYHDNERKK